ncbi:AhpC/Tsa family protein [Burkholderiales bacterium GJ-E10]|nr:AhpC/Tsa family protein [Burkholderiales bacterium GJ-E10]
MESLKKTIDSFKSEVVSKAPAEVREVMLRCTQDLKSSGIESRALKAGDKMPDFELPNQHGTMRRLYQYLKSSPVVLNIYRGGWCPYCNFEMKALRDALPMIKAKGAQLIGMSPELPSKAELTASNNGIDIDILYDAGNAVSERLGLVFELPEVLRPIYQQFGIDIPAFNGDASFRLPVPATYILERDGSIRYAHIDADYTARMEPTDIIMRL